MQRQHPLLSPTGLVVTAIVLVIMGIYYWRTGGRMFNPGPLSAAHADINDCASCHRPLANRQAAQCLECHTEIQAELAASSGLHARLKDPDNCRACHPDHRGEDFDMVAHAVLEFDHSLTFFSLARHGVDYQGSPINCETCHTSESFAPDLNACVDCHAAETPDFMAQHVAEFGPDCLACHDGVDRLADFDHAATQFPLTGEHAQVGCIDCHQEGQFEDTSPACAACHTEPAIHAGLFQDTCEDCHTPDGWSPALLDGEEFDHFAASGFSLVRHESSFDGSILNCKSCHQETLESFSEQVCVQCHTTGTPDFMAQHISDFGMNCLDCHDGLDSMKNFDHNQLFVLDGAHAELACTSCHIDHSFAGTPSNCAGCHAEPEIHAGTFGLQCENCHTTTAWHPAALTRHSFPLNHGGQGEIECATCHPANFVQYTCDSCHDPVEMRNEHDKEGIFDIAGRCLECHPTGLKEEGRDDD